MPGAVMTTEHESQGLANVLLNVGVVVEEARSVIDQSGSQCSSALLVPGGDLVVLGGRIERLKWLRPQVDILRRIEED